MARLRANVIQFDLLGQHLKIVRKTGRIIKLRPLGQFSDNPPKVFVTSNKKTKIEQREEDFSRLIEASGYRYEDYTRQEAAQHFNNR